ncbi:hypothetical protein L211DRAFT_426110 [Terfezia boudieri ATCC MYA-4762]|uniref:LYR motif-containing protein 2 n=1 Tax=Terfezia boudieri ATCC MYA-4762 TaxID=1051890 RepID=A0A3N4LJQ9_9PEZI|nr:hypothetical protein L211DRAFT_426110 [Terfezia boudieri ATCC MYA-4762]
MFLKENCIFLISAVFYAASFVVKLFNDLIGVESASRETPLSDFGRPAKRYYPFRNKRKTAVRRTSTPKCSDLGSLPMSIFLIRAPLTCSRVGIGAPYASYATAIKPGGIPTLKQFILRSRVLGLYRNVLRTLRNINPSLRTELKTYARGEFERNRFVAEESHVRYLLSLGEKELGQMKRYIMGG